MEEKNNQSRKSFVSYNEIDLRLLVLVLWEKKISIFIITSLFAIFSVFYSLSLPNIYHSSATIIPSSGDEALSNKLNTFPSIPGISSSVSAFGEVTKSLEAVERIKTLEFFSNHFLPNIKLQDLLAVKEWDPIKNEIIYDEDIYDEANKKWVRKVSYPKKNIPSSQEAYRVYKNILIVNESKKSLFINLTIQHKSPYIAKNWLDVIITNINESIRDEDKKQAINSIDYLDNYSKRTVNQSLQDSISSLKEAQLKTLMLVSSSEDYVFKIIESPYVPEFKSGPQRAIICIVITMIGFIMSIIFVLINFARNQHVSNTD